MAFTGLQRVEQRVGKTKGQDWARTTVQYTYWYTTVPLFYR